MAPLFLSTILAATLTAPDDAARSIAAYTRLATDDAHVELVHGERETYVVRPRLMPSIPSAPRFVVDARTSAVLEAVDTARGARALAFATSPAIQRNPALFFVEFGTKSPLGGGLLRVRSCVDRGDLLSVFLDGSWSRVRTCSLLTTASPDANGDFTTPPADFPEVRSADPDPFAESSLYHHATRTLTSFQALGAGDPRGGPLDLVANARVVGAVATGDVDQARNPDAPLVPLDAAVYLPAGDTGGLRALYPAERSLVLFGQGTRVDFAYDGQIVAHELTHAVLDGAVGARALRFEGEGVRLEAEAVGEALADYFAAVFYDEPTFAAYATRQDPRATPRSVDNHTRCPDDITGEPHQDGLVLSGALYRSRARLPDADHAAFDRAVLSAAWHSPRSDAIFSEFGTAVIAALGDASGADVLREELARSGVLPSCPLVRRQAWGRALDGTSGGFVAPGTARALGRSHVPGVVQVQIDVPPGIRRMRVRFTATSSKPSPWFGRLDAAPAKPELALSFDAPVSWTEEGTLLRGDWIATHAVDDHGYEAEVTVPEGRAITYVQIANGGELDGAWNDLVVEEAPPMETRAPAAEGSGCSTAGSSESDVAPIVAAWCGCLVVRRRRRRRGSNAVHGSEVVRNRWDAGQRVRAARKGDAVERAVFTLRTR